MRINRASLEAFHVHGIPPKYIPSELRSTVRRELIMLDSSHNINDLRTPPGNRLERLKGDMRDYHAIRVNSRYRIVFRWTERGVEDVDFIDYH